MSRKQNQGKSIVVSAIAGSIGGGMVCTAGLLLLAKMVLNERIGESGMAIWVAILLVVASLVGGLVSGCIQCEQGMVSSMIVGVILVLAILCGGMLADGRFTNVLINLGAITVGTACSCLLCMKQKGRKRIQKKRNR